MSIHYWFILSCVTNEHRATLEDYSDPDRVLKNLEILKTVKGFEFHNL